MKAAAEAAEGWAGSSAKRHDDPAASGSRGASGPPGPSDWAAGKSPADRAEWLVDAFRLHEDDMMVNVGQMAGLYTPVEDLSGATAIWTFLFFTKLCVRSEMLPPGWDWELYFRKADGLLPWAFDKEEAREKYGGENIFSAVTSGKPSLRYTAAHIYDFTVTGGGRDSDRCKALQAEMYASLEANGRVRGNFDPVAICSQFEALFFNDVGGVAAWIRLEAGLDATLAKMIKEGKHADMGDQSLGLFGGCGMQRAML